MNNNIEITTESNDGDNYKLVLSQSFSLLNRNDKVNIKLPAEFHNWIVKLVFWEDTAKNKYEGETKIDGSTITYNFYNWDSDTYVENVIPHELNTKDKKTVLKIKIRTTATLDKNYRLIIFSLWKKI